MKLVAVSILALVGCASEPTTPSGPRAVAFDDAARAHGVPVDWLLAVGYQQGRFEVAGTTETDAMPDDPDALPADTLVDEATEGTADDASPGGDDVALAASAGIMYLTDPQVARAATLTGHDPDAIRADLATNVDAAAALLADGDDLRAATAALLGVADDPDAAALALGDLDATVAAGFDLTTADGEHLVLAGADPRNTRAALRPGAYPARQWIASPNYSSRLGYAIHYVVIHDIEGTMASAVTVFKSRAAQASAHYIVRARDGHVVQMVHEDDNAWHTGHAWFNRHSIGIEHEGFAGRKNGGGYYDATEYEASAALTCAIAHRHGIPVDRKHIFGHYNVPSNLASHTLCSDAAGAAGRCGGVSHHSDPGRYWRWNHYMTLVAECVHAANR